jgi:hypothetical protein
MKVPDRLKTFITGQPPQKSFWTPAYKSQVSRFIDALTGASTMLKFLPNCHFFSGFLRLTCGLILGLALSLPSHSAQADFLNGTELQVYCTSQNPTDDAICLVYITGAVDAFTTLDLIAEKTTDAPRMFCLPDDIGQTNCAM